jgi:hypothetical protein
MPTVLNSRRTNVISVRPCPIGPRRVVAGTIVAAARAPQKGIAQRASFRARHLKPAEEDLTRLRFHAVHEQHGVVRMALGG